MRIPMAPPDLQQLLTKLDHTRLMALLMMHEIDIAPGGRYRHWDKLRFLEPPSGLTTQEWWAAIKFRRMSIQKILPLRDRSGQPFTFCVPDLAAEMLPQVDRGASGRIEIDESITNPNTRDRYIVSSLINEAIFSSQLEGAATTRRVAENMLRNGRPPKDRSEQMILNNFRVMERIRGLRDQPLSPTLVLELHRIVTDRTLEAPDAAGRLRTEPIYVIDRRDNEVLHNAPNAVELPSRLDAMCAFANGNTPTYFIHPVLRAVLLHFWLAYDHPFVDGNGRTARALFYWAMLHHDYWLCEYISISGIVKRAPAKYNRAFLYSESENDATYFVLYHLVVILRAITELTVHLRRSVAELKHAEELVRRSACYNHRQLALIAHALRHPGQEYTVQGHAMSHNVTLPTARADLLGLESQRLFERTTVGNKHIYSPVDGFADALRSQPGPRRRRRSTTGRNRGSHPERAATPGDPHGRE